MWLEAERKGQIIKVRLQKYLGNGSILSIRGYGLELGIQLKNHLVYKKVVDDAQRGGLLLIGDGESTLQIMPPLTISDLNLEKALDILDSVLLVV